MKLKFQCKNLRASVKRHVKPESQAVDIARRQSREVQGNVNSEMLKIINNKNPGWDILDLQEEKTSNYLLLGFNVRQCSYTNQ
jgi:hypothetical protein